MLQNLLTTPGEGGEGVGVGVGGGGEADMITFQ